MRCFEKISFDQFKKDIGDNEVLYNDYNLPVRKTKYSAGYDFVAITDYLIKPGEGLKIPLGIKANMEESEFLMLVVRSSLGIKNNIRMCNQVGIIDKDYYNNTLNEGHIWVKLYNHSNTSYEIKKGSAIVQGIFTKYLTVTDENSVDTTRQGGFGSTN